jgi:hypothetical protein
MGRMTLSEAGGMALGEAIPPVPEWPALLVVGVVALLVLLRRIPTGTAGRRARGRGTRRDAPGLEIGQEERKR